MFQARRICWIDPNGALDTSTPSGIRIMHPGFHENAVTAEWCELSVRFGSLLELNDDCKLRNPKRLCQYLSNVLDDGTLIDLGDVVLLWRSGKSLEETIVCI